MSETQVATTESAPSGTCEHKDRVGAKYDRWGQTIETLRCNHCGAEQLLDGRPLLTGPARLGREELANFTVDVLTGQWKPLGVADDRPEKDHAMEAFRQAVEAEMALFGQDQIEREYAHIVPVWSTDPLRPMRRVNAEDWAAAVKRATAMARIARADPTEWAALEIAMGAVPVR